MSDDDGAGDVVEIPEHIVAYAAGVFMFTTRNALSSSDGDPRGAWQEVAGFLEGVGHRYHWRAWQQLCAQWATEHVEPKLLLTRRWF